MYEFKPRPKVVPQAKAVKPTSKLKPDPEVEKEKKKSTVQSDIQTPEKTDGITNVGNSETTNTATGLQGNTTTTSSENGGDAFQQLIAKDPITQLLENDPITQLLDNDPFIQLVNNNNAPTRTLTEKTKDKSKATTVEEDASDKATIKAIKEKKSAQDKPKLKIESASPEAAIGSVTKLPPLQLFDAMDEASTIAAQAQQNQLNMKQEGMEEITIPTGIDATSEAKQPTPKVVAKGKTPTIKTPTTAKKVATDKATKSLDKETKKAPLGKVTTKRGAFIKDIQKSRENLGNVQTAAQSDLGAQPAANFDEASNPAQIQANNLQAQQSVGNELGNAQKATTQDFGESGMFPKKASKKAKITINTELTEQRQSLLSENTDMPSFDDAETANINKELQARYQGEIDAAEQDMQVAGTDKDQNITQEKDKHHQDMMTATEEAKATQRLERTKGQQEVVNQKENWQAENQKIKEDASMQLAKEQTKNEASITKKQAEGNKQIADTYAKADKDIAAKTKKADEDVAKQEKEGVEKEEKGWFDSAIDWVSDQFDKIKKAVNFIFDKLRAAVKSLVNWAKEKASGIINAVRDFAIKAVKVFGEIAKSVVSAALFMFPETAKKFNAFIDKKVAQTIDVINKVAAALEKTVHALLDAVGRVIDAVLAVYQKVMNAVLDVLEFITVGAIIILRFFANLGIAAFYMPDHLFWGQIFEAMLGQDPTKPLANIERTEPVSLQNAVNTVKSNDGLLNKEELDPSDIEVEEALTREHLSPELLSELGSIDEGIYEFEGSDNPFNIQEFSNTQTTVNPSEGSSTSEGFDFANSNDNQKLQYYLDEMKSSSLQGDLREGQPEVEEDKNIPDVMKVGPLDVSQRLWFIKEQLIIGLEQKWNENKHWIIPTVSLVAAGLLVAIIATAGAAIAPIFSLLMTGLNIIFGAILIAMIAKPLWDYVKNAFNNDPEKASVSLAKAFAIGLVELIFTLIFRGVGKLLKGIMKGISASFKAAKFVAKHLVKGVKTIGRYTLKNGKLVLGKISKTTTKGYKKISTFTRALSKRLRINGFKIIISGRRVQLWVKINPWRKIGEFFHGGLKSSINNIKNKGVDLNRGRTKLDFNSTGKKAFYTSDNLKDTIKYNRRFKNQLTDIAKFKIPEGELSKLKIKIFEGPTKEWAEFVTKARNGTLKHDFDIVAGPKLANPKDVLTKGATPKGIKKQIQIAFTSEKAVEILNKNIIQ